MGFYRCVLMRLLVCYRTINCCWWK